MRIQSLNHSTYQHLYHIVWGTKYRYKYLKPYVKEALFRSFYATEEEYPTLHFESINTDEDHIHIQIEIAPSVSIAETVKALKARSSMDLKEEFPFIKKMYLDEWIWSVGYFSSTLWLNEKVVRKYIEEQGKLDFPSQSSFEFE